MMAAVDFLDNRARVYKRQIYRKARASEEKKRDEAFIHLQRQKTPPTRPIGRGNYNTLGVYHQLSKGF
jgi:hypothetical protein